MFVFAAGTYFPAVSLYMGGSVRVNFGPEFVYPPPRSHGWKPVAALKPFSKDEMKVQIAGGLGFYVVTAAVFCFYNLS